MTGQTNDSLDNNVHTIFGRGCCLENFIIYSLIVGTLVVVGIIGNSLTFVVFWKGNFKSSTSFLFLSLSLIDSALLLVVFTVYTMTAFVDYTGWMQGFSELTPYLRVYMFPSALLAKTATVWVIVLIAVNRYIIVCLPLRAPQWCTITKVKIQLAIVLIAAVVYAIPKFAEYRIVHYTMFTTSNGTSHRTSVGLSRFGEHSSFYRVYDSVFLLTFLLVLPILILTVLTIRLIKAMKAHRRMQFETQSRSQPDDGNVTFALVIVVIVFIPCQVPTFVYFVLRDAFLLDYTCGTVGFYMGCIANILVVFNSAINFVIYTITNRRFRDVLLNTVCRRGERRQLATDHRRWEGQRQSFQLQ